LSSEELYQNLLIVIQANLTPNKQSLSNISSNLKPRTIRDAAVKNETKELMEKIQDARLNKLIEQQKSTPRQYLLTIHLILQVFL
jgi:hypothetical protein